MWMVFAGLALVVAAAWFAKRPARQRGRRSRDIDREQLEAAEREVRDLDAHTTPDEADEHLPDWGPGAPGA